MENAHLRMGLLEYERHTEKIATRIRVRVSHYLGEERRRAFAECLWKRFRCRSNHCRRLRESAIRTDVSRRRDARDFVGRRWVCYRGGRQHSGEKTDGTAHDCALRRTAWVEVAVAHVRPAARARPGVWAALVHRFGFPGLPEWAERMTQLLTERGRITAVDSIGCSAVVISATCEELVEWMGDGVSEGECKFPE